MQNLMVVSILSDCNWTRTQKHLVLKRTLNHLAKLAKWFNCVLSTYLYGGFDCMFLSCHVRVSEWIHSETRKWHETGNYRVWIRSILDWKYLPFLENLVQKMAIVSLAWKLVFRLIRYEEFNSDVHFLCFRPEVYFLWKFIPRIKIVC